MPSPAAPARVTALARVLEIADAQGGVVGRRQLYAVGVERWHVRAHLRARRWRSHGRQCLAVHTGELTAEAQRWRALIEVGPRAALDGVTALHHAGLEGFDDVLIHVIAPKSSCPRRARGVRVHESRRFQESAIAPVGIRCVVTPVAAVHAALWARSDRQAVLLLTMTVQQRLATAADIELALMDVRRHRRRRLLAAALRDIGGGSHSLGELDVLTGIRRRGLPEPTRQAVRRLAGGTAYLDVEWEDWALVLEIDGSQHEGAVHRLADLMRDLEVVAGGRTVLRIPLVAWRLDEDAILDRLTAVFLSRGWSSPGQARATSG